MDEIAVVADNKLCFARVLRNDTLQCRLRIR
jgi:hypothetical protein